LHFRLGHGPAVQLTTFTSGCVSGVGGVPRPRSRYTVLLYTPFLARSSLPIGHVLLNMWVPC
jgi:hypothetical protein